MLIVTLTTVFIARAKTDLLSNNSGVEVQLFIVL